MKPPGAWASCELPLWRNLWKLPATGIRLNNHSPKRDHHRRVTNDVIAAPHGPCSRTGSWRQCEVRSRSRALSVYQVDPVSSMSCRGSPRNVLKRIFRTTARVYYFAICAANLAYDPASRFSPSLPHTVTGICYGAGMYLSPLSKILGSTSAGIMALLPLPEPATRYGGKPLVPWQPGLWCSPRSAKAPGPSSDPPRRVPWADHRHVRAVARL